MDTTEFSSYFSVSIFIAIGTLVVLSIFIFGKRQISRFTVKSTRRPHLPTGHTAPQALRQNIQQMLTRISDITYEPRLIDGRSDHTQLPHSFRDSGVTCNYKYRMLALDALSAIDVIISKYEDPSLKRNISTRLRTYLTTLQLNGPLRSAPREVVRKFADSYDHARHIADDFGQREYENYIEELQLIISYLDQAVETRSDQSKVDTRVKLSNTSQKTTEIVTLPVATKRRKHADKPTIPLVKIDHATPRCSVASAHKLTPTTTESCQSTASYVSTTETQEACDR